MQMWSRIGSNNLNVLLRNRRYPRKPDMTINVPGLKSPVNMDNNYGLRLTAYYKVGYTCFLFTFVFCMLGLPENKSVGHLNTFLLIFLHEPIYSLYK
jgi:hypothetical protein